jgi:hypothetical protein
MPKQFVMTFKAVAVNKVGSTKPAAKAQAKPETIGDVLRSNRAKAAATAVDGSKVPMTDANIAKVLQADPGLQLEANVHAQHARVTPSDALISAVVRERQGLGDHTPGFQDLVEARRRATNAGHPDGEKRA